MGVGVWVCGCVEVGVGIERGKKIKKKLKKRYGYRILLYPCVLLFFVLFCFCFFLVK